MGLLGKTCQPQPAFSLHTDCEGRQVGVGLAKHSCPVGQWRELLVSKSKSREATGEGLVKLEGCGFSMLLVYLRASESLDLAWCSFRRGKLHGRATVRWEGGAHLPAIWFLDWSFGLNKNVTWIHECCVGCCVWWAEDMWVWEPRTPRSVDTGMKEDSEIWGGKPCVQRLKTTRFGIKPMWVVCYLFSRKVFLSLKLSLNPWAPWRTLVEGQGGS